MEELSQIESAYRNLQERGKRPNFLFTGGGLSDVSQFDAFALYAKDLGIRLTGIVYDGSVEGSSNRFSEEHVLGIESTEYVLVHETDGAKGKTGFFRAFKEVVQGCFIGLPSRMRSLSSLQLEDLGEVKNAFFLIRPKCGFVPPEVLGFLATLEQDNIIHIVLEEGIGSYLMTSRDWWFLGVDRELDPLKRSLKSVIMHLLWPMKKRQLLSISQRMTAVSFTLFQEGRVLRKNAIPCHYFERALEAIGEQRDMPALDFSNTVIIATTRFADFEASDFESECLGLVVSIMRGYGYRVILRPHPSEKLLDHYGLLDVEMDPHMDVSLETQVAASKVPPVAILGFMSSAQLIANALWNVEAICLSDVLSEQWSELAKENGAIGLLNREIQDAKGLFKDYVKFPHGVGQLEAEIASLR